MVSLLYEKDKREPTFNQIYFKEYAKMVDVDKLKNKLEYVKENHKKDPGCIYILANILETALDELDRMKTKKAAFTPGRKCKGRNPGNLNPPGPGHNLK